MDFLFLKEKRALKKSEAIIKQNSATFNRAFNAIPNRSKRNSVFAVYAFCRIADDLIDENQDPQGLNSLKEEVSLFFENPSKMMNKNWLWRALGHPYRKFYHSLPLQDIKQPYLDMIRGQEMDLVKKEYQTIEELLGYCYCVASSVGLMLLPILAPDTHQELKECALHLGYAMQLTNILRDVGEDFKRGRIYLPQEWMKQAKYTKGMLSSGIIDDKFISLFERIAKEAENYYRLAASKLHLFPNETRHPLALAALLYENILTAIRQSNYDVFSKKNFVSDEDKQRLIKEYKERNF